MTQAARLASRLLAVAAVGATREARADELTEQLLRLWVSPGVVHGWSARDAAPARGWGFELSAGKLYGSPTKPTALGLVYRGHSFAREKDDVSFTRRTVAAEVVVQYAGLELGWGSRGAQPDLAAARGLHVMPFLTMGVFYVGAEGLVATSGPRGAWDVVVGLKLPLSALPVAMAGVGGMTAGGRPLGVAGAARVAAASARVDWA